MHSVGIEPTLLRTRALSVRLNRSAKSASMLRKCADHNKNLADGYWHEERLHGAMATRRIPDPKIGGSIPSGVILLFYLSCKYTH